MSANNHDNGDPNIVRYAKQSLTPKHEQNGMVIHVYANAVGKTFSEFKKWFEEQGYTLSK